MNHNIDNLKMYEPVIIMWNYMNGVEHFKKIYIYETVLITWK